MTGRPLLATRLRSQHPLNFQHAFQVSIIIKMVVCVPRGLLFS
jgi:hypothetical protein